MVAVLPDSDDTDSIPPVTAQHSFTVSYSGCKQATAINPPSPLEVNYEVFEDSNEPLTLEVPFPTSSKPGKCSLTYNIEIQTDAGTNIELPEGIID